MGGCLSRRYKLDPSKDLLDLTGKIIIVTGGNTGIGYETVKCLARRGAKVYLGARNESKATGALARLEQEGLGPGNGQVIWFKVDFSDPRLAKEAAEAFLKRESRLDILINNAAQLTGPFQKTKDGISQLMVVNHFSPFVFTRTLLPVLIKTSKEPKSDVRIVSLSSITHSSMARATSADLKFETIDDFNHEFAEDIYPEMSRYSVTKLATILWMRELQKRFDASNTPIVCMPIHPGEINTFAARTPYPFLAGIFMAIFFAAPEVGAYGPSFAAASPKIRDNPEKYKGAYQIPVGVLAEPSENAQRDDLARALWKITESILKGLDV
ncbi:NAD-P-binding protein [Collybia nuda]|uniref:NAD-P-binding protein n=1 Tax=Collybia nuda TaxID=64659 RepID=A0A9P5YAE3_9AGAR|nr:NAD-P-binding protein [Collybia nuda]